MIYSISSHFCGNSYQTFFLPPLRTSACETISEPSWPCWCAIVDTCNLLPDNTAWAEWLTKPQVNTGHMKTPNGKWDHSCKLGHSCELVKKGLTRWLAMHIHVQCTCTALTLKYPGENPESITVAIGSYSTGVNLHSHLACIYHDVALSMFSKPLAIIIRATCTARQRSNKS